MIDTQVQIYSKLIFFNNLLIISAALEIRIYTNRLTLFHKHEHIAWQIQVTFKPPPHNKKEEG
jgi:hypothetical protein